ncbi:DEAD/DEAH box helicase [Halosegnis marinus]|uniref:DEAD/DEAH box helicase n=1 Tax=Halosegnis marinus TaxID=3034023 RepID=A0ABD5ZSA5_9EURY|nr:DEAD/DEAH box helicase [Halosegnis sp. DT85]
MDDTVAALRERPYYDGQIADERVLPGREAATRPLDTDDRLARALADRGIDDLYEHQARAVEATRAGRDVVLATPTASGKSLAYTVPAFERAMDHVGTTLYVGPQVALINDQRETLSDLADGLGFGSRVTVDEYTGRLSRSEKEAVRERQPTVLLATPDMLHYGILPHSHRLWKWFFERLETVVVDEVHAYRGIFGSHVSLVFRRLNRVCERFGADPDYVCCSATIGNPVEHAATVTGRDPDSFALVDEDTSASGPTRWVWWNPPEYEDGRGFGDGRRRSSHVEAKRLFCDLVARGHQTVVFTASRQTAERYATDSASALRERGDHDLASGVAAYQAALRDETRADIEAGLKSGEVRGVWSTNALELGVDIGGLDCVILDGYPGTRMNAFQQAGRAGRGTDPSLVVVVPGEDQLDQYFARAPDDFFDGEPERAVSNPENEELLPDHVRSAARETWLKPDDDRHFGGTFPDLVTHMESQGLLERRSTPEGTRWTDGGDGSPQHEMSLRTVSDREIELTDRRNGDVIASLPFDDGLRDAHPGAIYHHQGQTYEVVELDLDHGVAALEPTWADYYTRTLHEKEITVERDLRETTLAAREDVSVRFAEVTMRKRITGFERRDSSSGETLSEESLDLPETTLRTKALYFTVPDDLDRTLREGGDLPGGIHAAEHAMISMYPADLLCDRGDIGGLSTPLHPHTGKATIFVYDGYPGGVGLMREGFGSVDAHMRRTRSMLRACDCEEGCPACVQSPHCGNANAPLDKRLAATLLEGLTE